MSLIRVLQESRAIKEGAIFSLTACDYEMENMKQLVKEKDVILKNNKERFQELENHVADLKEQCVALQKTSEISKLTMEEKELEAKLNKLEEYSQMPNIVKNYERFINEITASHETIKEERNMASTHLANLEFGFADLVTKYERLKNIISGYQENQDTLLAHIEIYKNAMNLLQERYELFKKYATDKLNEAQVHVENRDKKHISELAKVKSTVLQSKVKISELEKTISVMSTSTTIGDAGSDTNKKSVFTPLYTNFS